MSNAKRIRNLALTFAGILAALPAGAPQARAFGRHAPVDTASVCAGLARNGMPQYKTADMSRFSAPSPDRYRYPYELPVVFHVVNHDGGIFSSDGFSISEGDLNDELDNARSAFRQCGIEVTVQAVYYWDAPSFLNALTRSRVSPNYLGEGERCLFAPTFRDGLMNVYLVDGVVDPINGMGRSHSMSAYWYQPELPGDDRFIGGASIIADYDRSGMAGDARYIVVPHEIGHVVMNTGHVMDGTPNLMQDNRDLLSYAMTPEQCDAARNSPLVRRR